MTPARRVLTVLTATAALCTAAFLCGRGSAPAADHGAYLNALMAAGFGVTDPDGFPVGRFDEN